jgi:hypothetical protein
MDRVAEQETAEEDGGLAQARPRQRAVGKGPEVGIDLSS